MKIKTAFLTVTLALLSITVMGQSGKFGHVNSQYIIQLMPEYDSISRVLVSLDSMYNIELERLQVEINKKIEEYSNDEASPQLVKDVKAQEIQELQIRAQAFQQRAQEDLQSRPGELMRPLYTKIIDAINEIAEDNDMIYVFDVSQGNPLYVSDKSTDLVPLILEKFGVEDNPAMMQGTGSPF
jgi:outer membrane protein